MNPHFKSQEEAEQVAYYFLNDVVANIKATTVLFEQYELTNNACIHDLELLSKLGHAVKDYENDCKQNHTIKPN